MVRLRPYKSCDAKTIVSWIKNEYAFRQWCADRYSSYPITAEMMNTYYKGTEDSDAVYEMTAFDESGIVGHLTMRFTDQEKKILRFGFVIVDDTKRKKGLGKSMLELAAQYAFDILKVDKITLGVFENNPPAYNCYKSVGFKESAPTGESYHIFGEAWNCIEMELVR